MALEFTADFYLIAVAEPRQPIAIGLIEALATF